MTMKDKKNTKNEESPKPVLKKVTSSDKYKEWTAEYPNLWQSGSEDDFDQAYLLAEEYKAFLDEGKTEREVVETTIESLKQMGFKDIAEFDKLKVGDKIYASIKGKGLVMAVIGKKGVAEGFNLLGAHIDSPRLDLKPNPLYEENDMVYLKTHYYGGIKKYQWPTLPLAIHGTVILRDGTKVDLKIGESEADPIFCITDLLPHLGKEQMARKATELVKGEELNLLVGGRPIGDKDAAKPFKMQILQYLHHTYNMVEKDFVSAEIEIVPALKARDLGFDRSFIAAYGHDDKVCAFPAIKAIMEQSSPNKTCVVLLTDKEEIGSCGNTGAQSRLYENVLVELFVKINGTYDELGYRKMIAASKMLSTDVSNGFDPTFASVSDPKNAAYMGKGIMMEKYVGSGGKYSTNDTNSEFFAEILRLFAQHNIPWQTGEMGKIDAGGGGTIAVDMANMGMEVIDCGVPVLSMHAPYEIISKIDLYFTYLAYKTFIQHI